MRWRMLILLSIVLLTILLRSRFFHEPFERDEGFYAYLGQEILRGAVLYTQAPEMKPPGIMVIYAAMIGLFGIESSEGIRIATAVYVSGTVLALYWMVRRIAGTRASLIAALCFAIFSSGPLIQGSSSNTENFMALPLVVSAGFFVGWLQKNRRSELLWAGLFGVCAVLIKPVAMPQIVLMVGCLVYRDIRHVVAKPAALSSRAPVARALAADLLTLAAAPVAVVSALVIYLMAQSALAEAIYFNYTMLKPYLVHDAWRYLDQLRHGFAAVSVEHLFLWLLYFPTSWWLLTRHSSLRSFFVVLLVPAALVGLSITGKFFPHYFIQLIPFLAIIAGIGLDQVLTLHSWRLGAAALPLLLGLCIFVRIDYPFYFNYTPDRVCIVKYGPHGYDFVDAPHIAEYIRTHTGPHDTIFNWNFEPQIYFLSGRRSPNRFTSDAGIPWARDPPQAIEDLRRSLIETPPVYIVVHARAMTTMGWDTVNQALQTFYFLEKTIGNYRLFRRRNLPFSVG